MDKVMTDKQKIKKFDKIIVKNSTYGRNGMVGIVKGYELTVFGPMWRIFFEETQDERLIDVDNCYLINNE